MALDSSTFSRDGSDELRSISGHRGRRELMVKPTIKLVVGSCFLTGKRREVAFSEGAGGDAERGLRVWRARYQRAV